MQNIIEKSSVGAIKGYLLFKYFRLGSNLFLIFMMYGTFLMFETVISLSDFIVRFL